MSELKIVAADGITGPGLDLLREYFGSDSVEVRGKFSDDELCEKIGGMDALLIRSGTTVTRKAIEAAGTRLKLIGRAGVGTDNIDKVAATERGIIVMNTPFGNTISAAEQAIALLFATARSTARADHLMQQGKWDKKSLVGVEVNEKILGLVGLGKIGSHVAKVMRAAGMEIIAFDPFMSADRAKQMGVELVDIDELTERADFISLHTPLTDQTRNLFNRERLLKAKKGLRIVNCARGGIIDETALSELVQTGHIAAAGIDVFSKEPMTEGPLFGVKDLTLTPHLGASTEEAEIRCGQQMAEQVISYFRDGAILNAVNVSIAADKTLKGYVEAGRILGRIGAVLLNTAPEKVEVACTGELETKDTGEINAAVVQGVLSTFCPEDVNLINAGYLAKQRGVTVSAATGVGGSVFTNTVEVTISGGGKKCFLSGTATGSTPRLLKIDDAEMDVRVGDHMLIIRYPDQPGYVGQFGTLLAKHNINIVNMSVGCLESRKRASMVIGLNAPASEDVMKDLLTVEGVERAYQVSL